MGNEEIAQPAAHCALRDRMRDLAGDIDQLHALLRANPDLNHHVAILWSGAARRQPLLYRPAPRARFHRAANSLWFGQIELEAPPATFYLRIVAAAFAGHGRWNRNRWNSGSSSAALTHTWPLRGSSRSRWRRGCACAGARLWPAPPSWRTWGGRGRVGLSPA